MLDASKRNYIISANHGRFDNKIAFPIIQVSDVGGKQLVKIRNPWGKPWDGVPCTDSECWPDNVTEDLKILETEEGSYWMCFKYMTENFKEVMINSYEENFELIEMIAQHETDKAVFMTCDLGAGRHTFSCT